MEPSTQPSVTRENEQSVIGWNTNVTNKLKEPTLTELMITFRELPDGELLYSSRSLGRDTGVGEEPTPIPLPEGSLG